MRNFREYELDSYGIEFKKKLAEVSTGNTNAELIFARKKKLMKILGASIENWDNWHWQMRNRSWSIDTIQQFFGFENKRVEQIVETNKLYRFGLTPYFASLIDPENANCPIGLQVLPDIAELTDQCGELDPMGEENTSPVQGITRRYPDRLIINVTNTCATFCRHCQRRRNIGEKDHYLNKGQLSQALNYVKQNQVIRDVLVTGGDALLMTEGQLDWLLGELRNILHVETIRIGTRAPVTLPQRITPELCAMLEKYAPIYINTQFNHPLEITAEAAAACQSLAKAGVVLGNQAVLLKGVNDSPFVQIKLSHELLKIGVRPYYLFQAKHVKGTSHFITSVETGLSIVEKMRGFTSGLAIPTYVVNAPGGLGKIPVMPNYVVSIGSNYIKLRTWDDNIIRYKK